MVLVVEPDAEHLARPERHRRAEHDVGDAANHWVSARTRA